MCPLGSGSVYFNYKDYYSVVLMVVADSKYIFVFVDVETYGKDCDSSIVKKSGLLKSIETDSQQLPEDKPFGLHQHLLRSFSGTHLHSRTVCSTTDRIIVNACILLHYFVRGKDRYFAKDTTAITGLEDVPKENVMRGDLSVNTVRNIFNKYFLSSVRDIRWQIVLNVTYVTVSLARPGTSASAVAMAGCIPAPTKLRAIISQCERSHMLIHANKGIWTADILPAFQNRRDWQVKLEHLRGCDHYRPPQLLLKQSPPWKVERIGGDTYKVETMVAGPWFQVGTTRLWSPLRRPALTLSRRSRLTKQN
ncbi:hypothetical protein PR048_005452 [Dryococelus australis]|uniref:DDE Tnp4 domain-containing protein n=1 Tax=Dryococelus australis TaxID=614101 RepID=A0ABQ9I8A7_9NEOP|nr:hypothetical protein PR048_005452 [Dryococelus australis]